MRGKWIEEHKVYKCGFRNMLNTPPLENTVHNVVNHVTKTCYQVFRLLQLHIYHQTDVVCLFLVAVLD
jgi:hypothetical protein